MVRPATLAEALVCILALAIIAMACRSPSPTATPTTTPFVEETPSPALSPTPTGTLLPGITPSAFPTDTPLPQQTPSPTTTPALGPLPSVQRQRAFPGLALPRMVDMALAPDGPARFFVIQQEGYVWALSDDIQDAHTELFLDISKQVRTNDNEEGLLGLAFDPDYADNGHLYLYYSASEPRRNVLSRFTRSSTNSLRADPGSELVILEIEKPFGNHNGGELAWGPDGYLYIGIGDGGAGGDPLGNGQNLGVLLAKILRIDVRDASPSEPYRIPPDNPFVGVAGARGEIWAYGLRNPWRFSFDRVTGVLWAGDVGQDAWEEVDIIVKGTNYGWNIMEGSDCYSPSRGCNREGLELPVAEYATRRDGCAIIGGYVYHGSAIPDLVGAYVYGDYCSGTLWGLRYENGRVTELDVLARTERNIISFAQDGDGELYMVAEQGIYRITP